MITGRLEGTTNGPVLFLGIDGENVTRLVAGEPILIPKARLRLMGLPEMAVVLHYGKTGDDILSDLKANKVKPTRVHQDIVSTDNGS